MADILTVMRRVPVFFAEVKAELAKVSWPSKKDLLGATWIMVVVTAILTAYIGFLDFVLSKGVEMVLR
jgi:preprotein translocase subunit SecE